MRGLCTTLCDDYADGAAVMIKSFLDNNTWYSDEIIVICWGQLSAEQKRRIGSLSQKIIFHEIDERAYSTAKVDGRRKWNYVPATRFAMFKLLGYDRLVYLDADVVVVGDIQELFDTPASFAACRLKLGMGFELRNQGGFDAGVFTVGSEFISEYVHDALVYIATGHQWSGNQVVLNLYFADSVEYLSPIFNVTTYQLTAETFETARIIHFTGAEKPWHPTARFSERRIANIGLPLASRALEVWDYWASKARIADSPDAASVLGSQQSLAQWTRG
jgi:lipopolysaccharide biosynthesis glycosyltransferase